MPRVDEPSRSSSQEVGVEYRPYGLAISMQDMSRVGDTLVIDLLLPNIERKPIKPTPPDHEDSGLPFTCSLLKAATVCDIIRKEVTKVKQPPIRIYLRRPSGTLWERIPLDAELTIVEKGKSVLNPKWFKVDKVKIDTEPLKPIRVL